MKDETIIKEYAESDKKAVSTFLKSIFKEMGWSVRAEDGLDNPQTYF